MRIFSWLVRAFIFFTLFAFALNNQHAASVHWFFGVEWRAPMVFVVLAAFAAGCALGAAAMLPGWWKGTKQSPAGANSSEAQVSRPLDASMAAQQGVLPSSPGSTASANGLAQGNVSSHLASNSSGHSSPQQPPTAPSPYSSETRSGLGI